MRRPALLLLLAACGDPAPPRPVAFDEYAATARDAYCVWAVRCRHVPDDATCRRLLDPKGYDTRRAADGMRLGRLRYDPVAAGRCLAAARTADCPAPPFLDPSCGGVFVGLVPQGGLCTTAYDCAGGAPCMAPVCVPGCCLGTCGPAPRPQVTPPLAEVGQACRAHEDCTYTAYCGEDGRCRALPERVGEHCLFGCATGDLYCDVPTETCHAHPALGAPCGDQAHCNPYWAFCDGVCKPRPGAGEPCDDLRHCVPSAFCRDGMCAERGGEGASCGGDGQCQVACDADAGACVAYATCGE